MAVLPASDAPADAAVRPTLPVLDAAGAQRRLGGSVRVWAAAARVFARDAAAQLEQLQQAVAQGRLDAAARVAHSIKGSAAWIGARCTEDAARVLEEQLGRGHADPVQLAALTDALAELLPRLQQALPAA